VYEQKLYQLKGICSKLKSLFEEIKNVAVRLKGCSSWDIYENLRMMT